MTQGQFLSGVSQVWIQNFPFPRLVASPTEGPSLPYYLPIAGGRIFGFIILFTNPSARAGYDTRSIFKWSLTGLNSEFSFSKTSGLTKAEGPSLPYYLPIAGGRIFGFIILFTNPSARAGYDTRSIFKRSLTGLNSEFSFSWTSCHNNTITLFSS